MSDRFGRLGRQGGDDRRRRPRRARRDAALERLESRELLSAAPPSVDLGESYLVDGRRLGIARAADQVVVRFDLAQGAADPGRLTAAGGPLAGFTAAATADRAWWSFTRAGDPPATPAAGQLADLDARRARVLAQPGVLDAAPGYVEPTSGERLFLSRDLIVALRPGADAGRVFARADVAGFRPLRGTTDQFIVTAATPAGGAILAVADRLDDDPAVAWAAPDAFQAPRQAAAPNDPMLGQQWHLRNTGQNGSTPGADANVAGAWDDGITGAGVVVAVVDDGFDLSHPDLAANIYVNPGEVPGDGVDNDRNGYVDDVNGWDFWDNDNNPRPVDGPWTSNHGTAVAGVTAARGDNRIGVAGAAYEARIMPIRIPFVAAPASTFAQAVYYASGRNASGSGTWGGAAILNHSYKFNSPLAGLAPAFDWSAGNGRGGLGALNFVASGNDSPAVTGVSFPASLPSVIAIGASTDGDRRSGYSQYGPELDFVAPSNGGRAGITTTDRAGTVGYDATDYTNSFGGTSSATPLAAGVGALMLQANPTLSLDEVRAALRATAKKIGGVAYDSSGFNLEYGWGKIDATAAVRSVAVMLDLTPPTGLVENGPATAPTLGTLTFGITPTISDYRAEIDWGDGTAPVAGTLADLGNGSYGVVAPPKSYPEGGAFGLAVRIIRSGSTVLTATAPYTVEALPMQAAGVAVATDEGQPFSGVVATFTDTDPDPMDAGGYAATVDWGDGVVGPATVVALGGNRFEVRADHVFGGGTYPVAVTIAGPGGGAATASTSAVVADAPLTLDPMTVSAVEGRVYDGPVAWFSDADPRGNPATYYKAAIDWGDGPYASADANRPVPDDSAVGLTSTLRIDVGNFTIAGLTVTLNLAHGRVGDLTGVLIAPDGTRITLFSGLVQGGADFGGTTFDDGASKSIVSAFAPFAGSFRPQESLSALEGKALSGTWRLELTDAKAGFTGNLIGWSLQATDQGRVVPAPGGGFHVAGNHIFPVGTRRVRVTVADGDVSEENTRATPSTANVANAPIVAVPARVRATEGVPFSGVVATFLDSNPKGDASAFRATIDWGDGTTTAGRVVADGGGQFVVVGDTTYQTASALQPGGAYGVVVTLIEEAADPDDPANPVVVGTVSGTSSATVANAPITAQPLTFNAAEGLTARDLVIARFLDSNTASVPGNFRTRVNWGPNATGTATVVAVAGQPGLFEIRSSDALYFTAGTYPVAIELTDSGGQTIPIASTAQVADAPLVTTPVAVGAVERTATGTIDVARFTDTNPYGTGSPAGFRARIDWGDGTTSVGTVVWDAGTTPAGRVVAPAGFVVRGGTTYRDPGTFPVVITITGDGGTQTVVRTTATVADLILPLTGGLDGKSDTGPSAADGMTSARTPVFRGTAEPRSIVTLYVTPAGGARVVAGRATADAAGNWSVRAGSLADGRYAVQALAADAQGRPSSLLTTLNAGSGLVVDGTSPRVLDATMDAASRTIRVRFADGLSGMPSAVLLNPALYGLGVPGRPDSLGRPTSLALDPADRNSVLARFDTSGVRGGSVVLSLNSAAMTDAAGNALDVRYFLPFPATNPGPGQPFLAQFNLNGGRGTIAAVPYVPPPEIVAATNYTRYIRDRFRPFRR
jgi:subtilisin family serine protease/subtilisin-like proprotein convertase family protein